MARMYPNPVSNFKNQQEEYLYNLFQEKLGDDYIVLYGRSWIDRSDNVSPDHECDFIITKPGSGIIIVEAKGGRWERKNGNWTCYGHPVKTVDDPFEQAKSNKYSLIKLLKSSAKWEKKFFPISFAIALPDTSFSSPNVFVGLPNILTFDELDYVDNWIANAMKDCLQMNYPTKTDQDMINYLIQTLMRDYVIKLNEILKIDDQKLLVFTEQQMILDKALSKLNRLTIQGCAGSGKTLMAIRQVKRLAQKENVKKILFTCYNRELGQWLASNTEGLKSKCTTLPILEFFETRAKEVGIIRDSDQDENGYYDSLAYSFLQANELLDLKFDAIVVDEGQSFKKDWWGTLETLLVDKDKSQFFIFYDDLQRIYHEVINPVPGDDHPVDLQFNLRNTAKIHQQATKFLPKEKLPLCNNITGEPVWVHFYEDDKTMQGALRKILRILIVEGSVSAKDIVILTPKKKNSFFLSKGFIDNKEKLGPYTLSPIESNKPDAIRYSTIQSFRGMERKVVIIAEMDENVKEIQSLIYLGCSRAKTKLIIVLNNDLDNEIKQKITEGCEDITMRT